MVGPRSVGAPDSRNGYKNNSNCVTDTTTPPAGSGCIPKARFKRIIECLSDGIGSRSISSRSPHGVVSGSLGVVLQDNRCYRR